MTNAQTHTKRELDILRKTVPDAIILPFEKQILDLAEAVGNSGQSGGSVGYTVGAICDAVKKLLMFDTIAPLTGDDTEWAGSQNIRQSAVFKDDNGKAFFLNAIVFQGEDEWDRFTGVVEGVYSRQYVKSFPFTPRTFTISVRRELYDAAKHGPDEDDQPGGVRVVSCGDGPYVYFIKDKTQLDKVFEYYDRYEKGSN
jgi:hypothetical protein